MVRNILFLLMHALNLVFPALAEFMFLNDISALECIGVSITSVLCLDLYRVTL